MNRLPKPGDVITCPGVRSAQAVLDHSGSSDVPPHVFFTINESDLNQNGTPKVTAWSLIDFVGVGDHIVHGKPVKLGEILFHHQEKKVKRYLIASHK